MNDPTLNKVLKWGIQNSAASRDDPATAAQPMSEGDREAMQQFLSGFKGPSDAQKMDMSLKTIEDEEAPAAAKYRAFEELEMLIENLDNANNLESGSMWTRLIAQLDNEDPELRRWAAWCCGTAVQNNIRSQERFLVLNAIPTLIRLAIADSEQKVRKTATTALSSTVRNFQPGLDVALTHTPAEYKPSEKLDANDMQSVDILINKLRAGA